MAGVEFLMEFCYRSLDFCANDPGPKSSLFQDLKAGGKKARQFRRKPKKQIIGGVVSIVKYGYITKVITHPIYRSI